IMMPFLEQFAGKAIDRNRATKLKAELPGIFNWALVGVRRLYRQKAFTACTVCDRALQAHRFASDPIRQFVDHEVSFGPQFQVGTAALYHAFDYWCRRNNRKPVNSAEFAARIAELPGVTIARPGTAGQRPRVFIGI